MNVRRVVTQLCWFGACMAALAAFGFALVWIDAATGHETSDVRDGLLILSAATVVTGVVLVTLACGIERHSSSE